MNGVPLRFFSRLLAAVLSAGLAPGASLADDVTAALGGMKGQLIGAATEEIAKNGEGSTIALQDGTLLHAFSRHMRPQDSKKYPNPDLWPAVVAKIVSHDQGRTWTEPEILFRSSTGENAMQPSLARLANRELGVSYSRIDSISHATKVFRYSRDDGRTWSGEILISPADSYWTSAHDRMIVLSTGRVFLTLHQKVQVHPEHMTTQPAYSDDNGRTWKLIPQVLAVKEILPDVKKRSGDVWGFWEASAVERSDGTVYMLGRTYAGYLYWAESLDHGLTWSELKPTNLPSSPAPGKAVKAPGSSDMIVVWNSCCVAGSRLSLSSAISTDGGLTWKWPRAIETVSPGEGRSVQYPAMTIIGDKAYVSYRATALSKMQEYMTVLPVSWFYVEKETNSPR